MMLEGGGRVKEEGRSIKRGWRFQGERVGKLRIGW
jgi:hypothetical protein